MSGSLAVVAPSPATSPPAQASTQSRSQRLIDEWAARMITEDFTDEKTAEILARDIRAYADELAGPESPPVERAIAETAAIAWFVCRRIEVSVQTKKGISIGQANYDIRRIDAAHRRHLAALRTLAQVRKFDPPRPCRST